MAIQKNAVQVLDSVVEDWEASTKRQSWHVPPGNYECDLVGADLEVPRSGEGAMGVLVFVTKEPIEGIQLRLTRFLTSKNKDGANYGIGQLLDEVDLVRAVVGQRPVDRAAINRGRGKAIKAVLDDLAESRIKDVIVTAAAPEKNATSGKTYQNLTVALLGSSIGESSIDRTGEANARFSKGDRVQHDGKEWEIVEYNANDEILIIKRGKKEIEVAKDDVLPV